MSDTTPSVLDTLAAYTRREATLERLFRTFVSHKGWIASTLQLKEYLGWEKFDSVRLCSTDCRFPSNMLWIFSDQEAVQKAQEKRALLGPCAGDLDGAELFSRLPVDLGVIVINPGSDAPYAFSIENKYIPMAKGWGDAVRFESLLANAGSMSYAEQCELFRKSPELIGFVDAHSHALITLPGSRDMENPAAVFTAPDTMGLFMNALAPEQVARLKLFFLRDDDWFDKIPTQGMDGLVVNVCGGGPVFAMKYQTAST